MVFDPDDIESGYILRAGGKEGQRNDAAVDSCFVGNVNNDIFFGVGVWGVVN